MSDKEQKKEEKLKDEREGKEYYEKLFEKEKTEAEVVSLSSLIKKGLEKGLGVITTQSVLKEIVAYIMDQIEDTKKAVVKIVARETREFLENTDIVSVLSKVLTTVSLEIKTEIKFKPVVKEESPVSMKVGEGRDAPKKSP